MLETHQTDIRIIRIVRNFRDGGTLSEIEAEYRRIEVDKKSRQTILRHLPGLKALGILKEKPAIRDGRAVKVYTENRTADFGT